MNLRWGVSIVPSQVRLSWRGTPGTWWGLPQRGAGPSPGTRFFLFSRQVVSGSFRPHGPQHASLPCPPLPPRVTESLFHVVSLTQDLSVKMQLRTSAKPAVCVPGVYLRRLVSVY